VVNLANIKILEENEEIENESVTDLIDVNIFAVSVLSEIDCAIVRLK